MITNLVGRRAVLREYGCEPAPVEIVLVREALGSNDVVVLVRNEETGRLSSAAFTHLFVAPPPDPLVYLPRDLP